MAFRFEGLEVFQLAVDFAQLTYEMTRQFSKAEMFGLTANLRRAATSAPMNIAEGSGRGTRRDFIHFIDIATGSLFESIASFLLAERLGYTSETELDKVRRSAETLGRKLSSFKKSLSDHTP